MLSQSFFPALLFIPGVSALRVVTRVGAFLIAPVFWFLIATNTKPEKGGNTFPSTSILYGVSVWLALCLIHPDTNWPLSGLGEVFLYISIFSPVFWVGRVLKSPAHISRLMAILFTCNAFSAALGVAQVFRPETFNPPVIPALSTEFGRLVFTYTVNGGRELVRPCGLGDTPGQASNAGAMACLIGLALALRPIAYWKRIVSLGFALVGVAAIYYSQIRALLVVLILCIAILILMFMLQRNFAKATLVAVGGFGSLFGAMLWVTATVGGEVLTRFMTLFEKDPVELYQGARGGFVTVALQQTMWEFPLGMGLGRFGQIYDYFGNRAYQSIWVEVQIAAWVVDGGILLIVGYSVALFLAMFDTIRVALTTTDRELADWAAVVVASNFSIIAASFSSMVFLAPIGLQFWLLSAAIHVGDTRVKAAQAERRKAAGMAKRRAMEEQRQESLSRAKMAAESPLRDRPDEQPAEKVEPASPTGEAVI